MKKETKKNLISVVTIIGIYFVLGIIINYLGMKIYFNEGNYTSDSYGNFEVQFTLQNNAPLTLPFNNALYYYGIKTLKENISCRIEQEYICDRRLIDLRRLDAGDNKQIEFNINPNGLEEFNFQIKSYINIFNFPIFPKSEKINCKLLDITQKKVACKKQSE